MDSSGKIFAAAVAGVILLALAVIMSSEPGYGIARSHEEGVRQSLKGSRMLTTAGRNLTKEFLLRGGLFRSWKQTSRFKEVDMRSKATEAEIDQLLSQASRDLEPWKESGISLEMVEKAYCTEEIFESMRFQIVNGSYYLVGPTGSYQGRARSMQYQVMELHRKFQLPDVDFVLTTSDKCKTADAPHRSHDGNMTRCERLAPLFSNDKYGHEDHCVGVPDFSFGGWPEAYLLPWDIASFWVRTAASEKAWKDRKREIFWTGGATNEQRTIVAESEIVRTSGLADISMMSWGDDQDAFREKFKSLAEHCDYKSLLHLSGVAYSARLKYLMLCGSPVVFPHRGYWEFQEFWFHMLKENVNIVLTEPVSNENQGSPILNAVFDLNQNETRAQEIGEAGRYLATEVLHPDNVALYWAELITQYSALQTFQPMVHPDAVPLEVALLRPERPVMVKDRTCLVC